MVEVTTFGEWLTQTRQDLQLQRVELAARIGCAAVTLRKIEADERRPSRQMAEQLAEHLVIPARQREIFIRVARGEVPVDQLLPPRPSEAEPINLPCPTTSLVAREREIAEIISALSRPDLRLLTLAGAPGVGKTRLAIEAAARLRGSFPGGVFFAALTPLRDPQLVLVAVAHALHIATSGREQLATRLGRYLRQRRILLLLDNFEHLLGAAPQIAQLLTAAPHLKLLVTSRIALEVSGEHRFIVLPLDVPPPESSRLPLPARQAPPRYAAVDLFIQRARAANPGLELSDTTLLTVGEITRRLDGLPLAIECAATRVTHFTPHELLAQLDDRFTLLDSGPRDLPESHLTLWRTIDWSYTLLAPLDQQLFRRLSVFAGGCTIEAAQQVCNDDRTPGKSLAHGISALVDGSLLQRQDGDAGHSRYGMLDTVREYALGRLVASGEAATVRGLHAAYYLGLAAVAERAWDGPAEWGLLRTLVIERDNLRAALHWAIETRDAELALRLNAALLSFWTFSSSLGEAHTWLEAALAVPRPASKEAPAPKLAAVEAKVLNVAGYVMATSDHAEANAYFARGLALYRELGDSRAIAWSLRGCAFARMLHDEYDAAAQLLDESLRLCQATGDAWGHAWSLYALAFLKLAAGDLARARTDLDDALVQLRRQNIPMGVFRALLALGHTLFEQGDTAGAAARYREGLALSREAPLLTLITNGLEGLAAVAASQQRPLHAAHLWGAAEALREATDERRWHVFGRTYDRAITAARQQVAVSDWARAWAEGRALTAAQAVAEALEDADTTG